MVYLFSKTNISYATVDCNYFSEFCSNSPRKEGVF
nr:MAG TPA: hypothetical protein [Caudoviricetes sp.]